MAPLTSSSLATLTNKTWFISMMEPTRPSTITAACRTSVSIFTTEQISEQFGVGCSQPTIGPNRFHLNGLDQRYVNQVTGQCTRGIWSRCVYAWVFSSYHPGGGQFVMGDGAVKFLSEQMEYRNFRLGDRARKKRGPP